MRQPDSDLASGGADSQPATAACGMKEQMPVSGERQASTPNLDMLAKGVAVGVTVSIIVHAGKKVVGSLVKNPVVVFSLGFAVGFIAHRHRKKIIAVAGDASKQGKAFVLRQTENLKDLFVEADENLGE